jgi:hypothetical protein
MTIFKLKDSGTATITPEEVLLEPFVITTGYLRFAVDNVTDCNGVYLNIGNKPRVGDLEGIFINCGESVIIKIDSPKKFIGAKIFSNLDKTTISFIGNGLAIMQPFQRNEYITLTGCVDDTYNREIDHIRVQHSHKDLIIIDVDTSELTECNSSFTINLSTRIAAKTSAGTALLNISQVIPEICQKS